MVLMANTKPAVDSEETLHYILDKGAKTGISCDHLRQCDHGDAGKNQLTDMKKLAVAGAVGFTDDGVAPAGCGTGAPCHGDLRRAGHAHQLP